MYLAMNRFTVLPENAAAFEALWLNRESHLKESEGFVSFHMLKGPEAEGAILYASHTVWESETHFRAWTTSDAFRAAMRGRDRPASCTRVHRSSKALAPFKRSTRNNAEGPGFLYLTKIIRLSSR